MYVATYILAAHGALFAFRPGDTYLCMMYDMNLWARGTDNPPAPETVAISPRTCALTTYSRYVHYIHTPSPDSRRRARGFVATRLGCVGKVCGLDAGDVLTYIIWCRPLGRVSRYEAVFHTPPPDLYSAKRKKERIC